VHQFNRDKINQNQIQLIQIRKTQYSRNQDKLAVVRN